MLFTIYRLNLLQLVMGSLGGRIKYFSRAWELISADPWILNVVRHGLKLDFEAPPAMVNFPCNAHMSADQLLIGNEEVASERGGSQGQ
jgi:hypothetical protein